MSWYLIKDWTDHEDGIENVQIHYACTPPGQSPDWSWGHETRTLFDLGGYPRRRAKVLRMPREVWDMDNGWATPEYRLHYFYEVFQHGGGRWTSDLMTEEIVYRDLEYADDAGWLTHICIYWAVGDWTAPVYSPMEDPRFPADSEFRSLHYYGYGDKERFHYHKAQQLAGMERPIRWEGRMWGPQGSTLVQQYHMGRLTPEDKSEAYLGPNGPSGAGGDSWVHQL